MTDEILKKANELKEKIKYTERLEEHLTSWYAKITVPKTKGIKIWFHIGSTDYSYELPREVQIALWNEVIKYKKKLEKEFEELGTSEEGKND